MATQDNDIIIHVIVTPSSITPSRLSASPPRVPSSPVPQFGSLSGHWNRGWCTLPQLGLMQDAIIKCGFAIQCCVTTTKDAAANFQSDTGISAERPGQL